MPFQSLPFSILALKISQALPAVSAVSLAQRSLRSLLFSPMPLAAHQRETEMWQSWDSAMVGLVLSRLTFASAGL